MSNETNFTNFKRDLQTLNYAELNYLISDIMLEIKKRSYNEGMVKAMTSGLSAEQSVTVHAGETVIPSAKTPQQLRDEIIEKAKRDVAELIVNADYEHGRSVETIANHDKRTVVALLRGKYSGRVTEKGTAKCDPSDCFNSAIGCAIAIRRALGLEVPEEYLNAPQPTAIRIGDIVQSLFSKTIGTVVDSKETKHTLVTDGTYYSLYHSVCNVIDDSREGADANE